jgi:putative NIF3 family GTP cyclohydrolase 1 type 2
MSTTRQDLLQAFDALLQPARFKDYGPNGLQVEGRPEVRKIVSGVTASLALIEAAVAARADAIFVHHGLFWRGQDGRVTGWMKQRLALLLAHDINLYAYHLPLDAHPELGNNAQLGLQLGLAASGRFGEQDLGFIGSRADGGRFADTAALAAHVQQVLGRHGGPGGAGAKAHPQHRLVHGRRPGLFRGGDRRGRRCLHHRRDFRAAGALRARDGRGLHRLRPPRLRALWRAGGGGAGRGAVGPGPRVHRYRQPGLRPARRGPIQAGLWRGRPVRGVFAVDGLFGFFVGP